MAPIGRRYTAGVSTEIESQAQRHSAGAVRPPPLVLHVRPGTRVRPAPEAGGAAVLVLGVVAGTLALVGVLVLVCGAWFCAIPFLAPGILGLAAALLPRGFLFRPSARTWTPAHFLELARPSGSDRRLMDLTKEWKRFFAVSKESREVISAKAPEHEAGRILCLGGVEVPDILELPFEPFIITPTQYLWRRLGSIAFAAIFVSLWLLSWTRMVPARIRLNLMGLWWLGVSGLSVAATWLWRTTVRPRYIRLAPGIVQVLEYSIFGRHRGTRNYEMCRGTTVFVEQVGRAEQPTRLIFRCGTRRTDSS